MDSSMKKIIIGDETYYIPDKVHILIEDLVKKNDRLRKKAKKAYRVGWDVGYDFRIDEYLDRKDFPLP